MKDPYTRTLQFVGIVIGMVFLWIVVSSTYTVHVKRQAFLEYNSKRHEEVTLHGEFIGDWERIPSAIMASLHQLGYDDVHQNPPPENSLMRTEILTNKNRSPRAVPQGLPTNVRFTLSRKDKHATVIRYQLKLRVLETDDRIFHKLDDIYNTEYLHGPLRTKLAEEFKKAGKSADDSQFKVLDRERKKY